MPDTKISAAADAGTLVATDMLPLARSGSTTAYHATMAEIGVFAGTNLPVASTTVLGGVKIDGTTVTIASGVISAPGPFAGTPAMDGTANSGAATTWSRGDHIHPTDTTRAPLASPALTGSPTAPTVTPATDSSTKLATTAFVQSAMTAAGAGVSSWNTRTGAVTLALADVTGVGGAPLASPAFTGTPSLPAGSTGVTQAAGTNNTSLATTAFVAPSLQAAQDSTGRNRLHNPGFTINQRTYVSGTALAAGAYGHDRWKAGASGCTYTFTQSYPTTTLTITAGSLQQIIEARDVAGGTYTLSWTGTAQGRVNAGTYAASPVTVAGLAANTAITVEFNTGTVGSVQFELGSVATPLDAGGSPQQILAQCQRFYFAGAAQVLGSAYTAGAYIASMLGLPVTMRAIPTLAAPGWTTTVNTSAPTLSNSSANTVVVSVQGTAAGTVNLAGPVTASADL